jgi:chromosomal replication initiator protein
MAGPPERASDHDPKQPDVSNSTGVENALRSAVSERLGEARFGLWFGDAVRLGVSRDGHALEVRVPDPFFREWIRSHYASSLIEAAEAVVGRPLRLSFQLRGDVEVSGANPAETAQDMPDSQAEELRTGNVGGPTDTQQPASSNSNIAASSKFGSDPVRAGQTPGNLAGRLPRPGTGPTRPARRLEDFVTGPGNRLAHTAAWEMAHSAGSAFNPLIIHSAVGLGKTHLLEGISHALRQSHPGIHVLLVTAEAFTNSFLDAMRTGALSGFRARHRGVGGLIVDDVHFLAAKRATQEEFLHTFNALMDKGSPIVLSADQHPRLISRLTDELVTRFLAGMVVKIESPDFATRCSILKAKAALRGIEVPEAVITYIAENLRTSVRELEGALHTVIAQSVLAGKRLDLNLAQVALRDTIRHTSQAVALADIEHAVCQLFQITAEALKSDNRSRALAYPRMLAMYLARKHTSAGYSEIGRYFGGRNHSTVISGEKKVEEWLKAEERSTLLPGFETVADLVADLERTLGT